MKKTKLYFLISLFFVLTFSMVGSYVFMYNSDFVQADDSDEDEDRDEEDRDDEDDEKDEDEEDDEDDTFSTLETVVPAESNTSLVAPQVVVSASPIVQAIDQFEVINLPDSDRDGIDDVNDPHPSIPEIYIVKDDNLNGIVDTLENEK
ncbi:MAG: hypothetical protein ACD_9C00260G0004 [uncultured bacterium]|nr:MAG: hypothetical protein ACD_9C00260G0004 [uncultured bacterium]